MKKFFFTFIIFLLAVSATAFFLLNLFNKKKDIFKKNAPLLRQESSFSSNSDISGKNISSSEKEGENKSPDPVAPPLSGYSQRVTKKPFGIYITPENSPVQPERFSGYHTGTDFEIIPGEENLDVPVYAVCNGSLLSKQYANGYGGIAVEKCELGGSVVTVIYGHLSLTSISKNTKDALKTGDQIGVLGRGFSQETNGERKHLHLGIHKGNVVSLLGYVKNKNELINWIDPMAIISNKK